MTTAAQSSIEYESVYAKDIERVVVSEEQITARVAELAAEVDAEYADTK